MDRLTLREQIRVLLAQSRLWLDPLQCTGIRRCFIGNFKLQWPFKSISIKLNLKIKLSWLFHSGLLLSCFQIIQAYDERRSETGRCRSTAVCKLCIWADFGHVTNCQVSSIQNLCMYFILYFTYQELNNKNSCVLRLN